MGLKVKLQDVLDAMDFVNDETEYYYCIKTEEVLMCFEGLINGDKNPELEEDMEENFEDYIPLPGKYELHEYDMMKSFIYSLPEGHAQNALFSAISGRGAFRRFKDRLYDLDLEQKWFQYRDSEYEKIARKWCEENEIEIIENANRHNNTSQNIIKMV